MDEMDNNLITDESLRQVYPQQIVMPTGTYSAREAEEAIQAGKQISQEQLDVLNDYWQRAGSQEIANRQEQQTVQVLPLQTQENVGFFTRMKNKFLSLFSRRSAQGNAVQEQRPQKFTVKKEEANRVCDRIARRHNPYADHVSYDIARQINNRIWMQNNTLDEAVRQGIHFDRDSIAYTSIFRAYVQGYRTNAQGEPATEEDVKKRDADIEWIKNYLSTEEDRHNSAIDKVVDDLLKLNLSPAMLKDSYICSHAAEIRTICEYFTMLSDIRTENPDYFANMDPIKNELLTARVRNFGPLFTTTIAQRFLERGLGEYGDYIDGDKERLDNMINVNKESRAPLMGEQREREYLSQRKQTERMLANLEVSRKNQERRIRIRENTDLRDRKNELRRSGIRIPSTALSYYVSEMEDIKSMMDGFPQGYERNKELIDKCLDRLERELNSQNESELKARSYSDASRRMEDELNNHRERALEWEMANLASGKAVFERQQMELHRSKSSTYSRGIYFILNGENPSEEFWELLTREYGEDSVRTWQDRLA